jgi:hypothetical protein
MWRFGGFDQDTATMNHCLPDGRKSCAACCGLYNVADGTRSTLEERLSKRTGIFHDTDRSPDALENFKHLIRESENAAPLDEVIHVCEFAGFLNENNSVVGCMLHPRSPGNANVDLRGMCHYGSMACKAFYCPAWKELSQPVMQAVHAAVDDWHLYGLVATDVDFVRSIFSFLQVTNGAVDYSGVLERDALPIFRQILSWKSEWPRAGDSKVRRSPYYVKGRTVTSNNHENVQRVLECLNFTFCSNEYSAAARTEIKTGLELLANACRNPA